MMEKVLEMPSCAWRKGSLETEERDATAPCVSLPCMGFAPGASGTPCFLAVNNIGGDRQNAHGRETVTISVMLPDLIHECADDLYSDLVNAVIIIAVFREIAFNLIIHNNAVFIADALHLCIFDRAEGIGNHG